MFRGLIALLLLSLNTIFWGTLIVFGGVVKFFLGGRVRRFVTLMLARWGDHWTAVNDRIMDALLPVEWDVEGVGDLDPGGHYLIVSNHLSWVDILVLFRAFHGHTALIRFFVKQSVIWMPVVGQACAAVDMPFMKRYTQEYLERHPEKRGKDLEATRRVCQRFREIPVAILIFLEGTRLTPEKHAAQGRPYRHLLRPRIGALSYVLASMGDQLSDILDVTLAYPGIDEITFWRFLIGGVPRVVVRVRRLAMPPQFLAPGITEPGPARERFKEEIRRMWEEKDELLEKTKIENRT
jgi:1-acyl-sn-glycerol-3-phosphate acyltransferase